MSIAMPAGADAVEAWARSLEPPTGSYRRRVHPGDGSPHPAVAGAVATLLEAQCRLAPRRPCLLCGADTALFVIDDCDEVVVGYWSCGCVGAFPGGEAPAGLPPIPPRAARPPIVEALPEPEPAPPAPVVFVMPKRQPVRVLSIHERT